MACSQESSETTAKVSYGLTLASGAATVGAMFVPGLNLLVAGSLVAGFATAATATVVGVYYTVSYRELIKQVADMQANLDGQTEEMKAINGRIDEMLKKAESLGAPKPGEEGHVDMDKLYNEY